jgi:hypothetical protein
MRGRSNRTPAKRAAVLAAIAEGLTAAEAAHQAGIARRTLFEWKAEDEDFRRDYDAAYDAGTDCFEQEARRRAFNESDLLLMFLMKQRDPKRFNTKQVVLAIGGSVDIGHTGDVTMHVDDTSAAGHVLISLPHNYREPLPPGAHVHFVEPPIINAKVEPVSDETESEPAPRSEEAA